MIDEIEQVASGHFFLEDRQSISNYFSGVGKRDVKAELILQRIRRLQRWLIEPGDRGACLKFICENCLRKVLMKGTPSRKRRFDFAVEVISSEIAQWFLDESVGTEDERQRAFAHFRNWANQVVTWNSTWYKPQRELAYGVFRQLERLRSEQAEAGSRPEIPPTLIVQRSKVAEVQRTFF